MINVYQPSLGEEEVNAVRKVIESNWLGKGSKVAEFEELFAEHLGVGREHIFTTNCCTEGLFLSMKAFDISEGDDVILPTSSFIGAGNAIRNADANIVFCDIDRYTMNVRAEDIERCITPNTKAVLVTHYGGIPCEMDEIMDLADSYHIKVIEDTACSVASRYKEKATGTIGDMGMWSFDAMKILVAGDGGIVYFDDTEKAKWASKYLYFGLESKSGFSNKVDQKWWEFEISSFGRRSIMNDITASMAIVQLDKLPRFIERRKQIHDMYDQGFHDLTWLRTLPALPGYSKSSYYFYTIQVLDDSRDKLAKYLRENEVYTTYRYYPLHWVEFFGAKNQVFEDAEWAAKHSLCIPIHNGLSDEDINYIIEKIRAYKK